MAECLLMSHALSLLERTHASTHVPGALELSVCVYVAGRVDAPYAGRETVIRAWLGMLRRHFWNARTRDARRRVASRSDSATLRGQRETRALGPEDIRCF